MPASNAPVTLSDEDRLMLTAALEAEADATERYQIAELRLRADVLEAKRAKVSLIKSICAKHGLDATKSFEYESETGVLSVKQA